MSSDEIHAAPLPGIAWCKQKFAPYGPALWRLVVLGLLAVALWLAGSWWIVEPSERLHVLLAPLGLTAALLRRRDRKIPVVLIGAGCAVVGLLLWLTGAMQARMVAGRFTWMEWLYQMNFTLGLFVLYSALSGFASYLLGLIPAFKAGMNSPGGTWAQLLRAVCCIALFVPFVYVAFNVHRYKYANITNPRLACSLPYEDVLFTADDGLRLQGWYVPRQESSAAIVVCHGIGANRGNVLSVVPFLHAAGYNVLLFDFRGHGDSAGHTLSYGPREADDVVAAVRWLVGRGNTRVGLYAFSMGGSAVLHAMASARMPSEAVRTVVLDSTFAELEPLARGQLSSLPRAVTAPGLELMELYSRLELGTGIRGIRPVRHIGRVSPRPLLLIHGTADALIPPEQARINYAAAKAPKELFWVENAGHAACYTVAGAAYERRITAFLRRAMLSGAAGANSKRPSKSARGAW